MVVSTNPFDDSSSEGVGGPSMDYFLSPGGVVVGSANPFDDGTDFDSSGIRDDNNDMMSGDDNVADADGGVDDDHDHDASNENGGTPVEASWQFLGDLPYRRVRLYSNVRWNRRRGTTDAPSPSPPFKGNNNAGGGVEEDSDQIDFGLAAFPASYLSNQRRADLGLDSRDVRQLLRSTTITKVAGCPNGGPIAAITLPIAGSLQKQSSKESSAAATSTIMSMTEFRIMTSSGIPLANVEFPPRSLALGQRRLYSAADVLTIGFTDRCILIVVLRDSLCLTYDMCGSAILPPFHILPNSDSNKNVELLEASVFEGGVAVLSTAMQSAVVELLDEHDDPAYVDGAHLGCRKILPEAKNGMTGSGRSTLGSARSSMGDMFGSAQGSGRLPPYFAIVTPLPTAAHASTNFYSYCTLAVLPRVHTSSRHPELFLSTSDNSVVIVDTATAEITDVDCRARIGSPIVSMSFAPNGRFLACFTQSSILTVISTSFETKVLDFDTSEGSSSPPRDMKWCGEDSVVLHWKNLGVLMVGPYGDWLRFPYDKTENLHIIPEIDCCRVVTDNSLEILQRVPPTTALLLRIGSIEPSAMLLDASDAFEAGSPASDEAARAITKTGMLVDAIETCTEAATKEFDVAMQKRLVRAASYGMHFSYKDLSDRRSIMGGPLNGTDSETGEIKPSPTAIKFVESARKLRVLNALRHPSVGFALSSSQYESITPTGVIARLVAMKRPALATSIAAYLNLDRSVRAFARASKAAAFVASDRNHTDAQTAEAAIKILNEEAPTEFGIGAGTSGKVNSALNRGGYATVALAAHRAGRSGVASLLLMLETSVNDKVPALLAIGSFADAAAVATNARDADLIFLTLMEFESACLASTSDQAKAQATYLNTLVSKFPPEAFKLLRAYYSSMQDVKYVMNLLLRGQSFVDAGSIMAKRALDKTKDRERQNMLKEASRVFGLGKESAFQKSCTDDYLELLSDQEILRNKYASQDVAPESSSVTSTIFSIIRYAGENRREAHKLFADAEKLAKKFRVPEKRLWHVKVRAFAESDQWANLRNLADSKAKPPIGFKPFALAAIKGKQGTSEIMRYTDRVTSLEDRYDLFCEAKLWKRALEEATKLKDARRIMHVRSLCNSPEIQQLCDELTARI